MYKTRLILAALTMLLLFGTFAYAKPIIYDNGGPNQAGGNEMTRWIQSEEFTLTQAVNLTDIHFWDLELPQTGYQGEIRFWITPDLNGFPDYTHEIGEGGAFAVTRVQIQCGVLTIFCEFSDDFNIAGPGFMLKPGTYHLSLHNGEPTFNTRSEFYWETTGNVDKETGLECDLQSITDCVTGNGSDYFNNGAEHAFYLTGTVKTVTPEPGTLLLFGSSVVGIAGMLRRKLFS